MLRRCISLLLLLGFVANHLAAIPHAHHDGKSADHDVAPHMHVGWVCHDHHHAHKTRDDKHREESTPGRSIGADRNHDSDAVYLSSGPLSNQGVGHDFSGLHETAVATLISAVPPGSILGDQTSLIASDALHARAPNCALYLALRALRI